MLGGTIHVKAQDKQWVGELECLCSFVQLRVDHAVVTFGAVQKRSRQAFSCRHRFLRGIGGENLVVGPLDSVTREDRPQGVQNAALPVDQGSIAVEG